MSERRITEFEKVFEDHIRQWASDFPDTDSTPISVALKLRHLHLIDEESLQELLRPFGVGAGEIDILTRLAQQPPPHRMRPSDLAELCMVTTGGITGRIVKLEKSGYVTRIPSTSDKRTIYVQMTESGEKLLLETRKHVAGASRFLNAIRALPPGERECLDGLLAKLLRLLVT